jgi:predicted Zn-ribbon and HTH transcriptional regulator
MSKHIDPNEIVRLYRDEGHTAAEVAAMLGCRENNILRRLEYMGVERRQSGRRKVARPAPVAPTPGQCRLCGRPIKIGARCKICIAIAGL